MTDEFGNQTDLHDLLEESILAASEFLHVAEAAEDEQAVRTYLDIRGDLNLALRRLNKLADRKQVIAIPLGSEDEIQY